MRDKILKSEKLKLPRLKIRTELMIRLLLVMLLQMLASIRWCCIPAMSHDNDNARNDDDALLSLSPPAM